MANDYSPSNDPLMNPKGENALKISTLSDESDSMTIDEIKDAYTNIGKSYANVAQNAAKDVGERQKRLIGNDFGGVTPQLESNYYYPAVASFRSGIDVEGTQRALSVAMKRGKAAAEANYNAAQSEYNNASNAYETFRKNMENGGYTSAQFDESMLPDDMTMDDFQNISTIEGMSKEQYINMMLEQRQNAQDVDWNVPESRAIADQTVFGKYNMSWDALNSMSEEDRQKFWRDPDVSIDWRNAYYKNEIDRAIPDIGQKDRALSQYDQTMQQYTELFDRVYEGLQNGQSWLDAIGVPENSMLVLPSISKNTADTSVPVPSTGEYGEVQVMDPNYSFRSDADASTLTEEEQRLLSNTNWLYEHVDDDLRKELKKLDEDKNLAVNQQELIKKRFELTKGKLIPSAAEQDKGTPAPYKEYYTVLQNIFGFDKKDFDNYQVLKSTAPQTLETLKHSFASAMGLTSVIEIADGESYYLINGKYQKPAAGTVITFALPGVVNEDGTYNSKEYEEGLKALQDLNNPTANHTDEEKELLSKTIEEKFTKYRTQCQIMSSLQSLNPERKDYANMFKEALIITDIGQYKDIEFQNADGENVKASDVARSFNALAQNNPVDAYKLYSDSLYQTYNYVGYIYIGNAGGEISAVPLNNSGTPGQNIFNFEYSIEDGSPENIEAKSSALYKAIGHGLSPMTFYNIISSSINIYNQKRYSDKQPNEDISYYVNPEFMAMGRTNLIGSVGGIIDNVYYGLQQGVSAITNVLFTIGSAIPWAIDQLIPNVDGKDELPFYGLPVATVDTFSAKMRNWLGGNEDNTGETRLFITLKEATEGGRTPGSYMYRHELMELQQQTLAHSLNSIAAPIWFQDASGRVRSNGMGAEHSFTGQKSDSPILKWMDETGVDVWNFSGIFAGGQSSANAIGKMAGNLAGAKVSMALGSAMVSGARSAISATVNRFNLALSSAITMEAAGLTSEMQGIVASLLASSDDIVAKAGEFAGARAAGAVAGTGALAGKITTEAVKSVRASMASTLAAMAEDGTNNSFIKNFVKSFTDATKESKIYSNLVVQLGEDGAEAFVVGMSTNAEAIAKEIVSQSSLAAATGLSSAELSILSARDQRIFTRLIRGMESSGATEMGALNSKTLFAKSFMKSLSFDELKSVIQDVVKGTKEAMAAGVEWTSKDTFRILQSAGWKNASKSILIKELGLDMVDDAIRDYIRNQYNPYLTYEGYKHQDTLEYFTNPYTWVTNITGSLVQFGTRRLKAQAGLSYATYRRNKALNALGSTGDADPTATMKAREEAMKWSSKAQQAANKAFVSGGSYTKAKRLINLSNGYTKKSQAEILKTLQEDIDYISVTHQNKEIHFRTTDEFESWRKTNKVDVFDQLTVGLKNAEIDMTGNYFVHKTELGGDEVRGLANINDEKVLIDMHRTEARVRSEYLDSVKKDSSLSIVEKSRKLYNIMVDNLDEKYGRTGIIDGLKKSLNMYYQYFLDDLEEQVTKWKKQGLSEEEILARNLVRLGYTPDMSWYNNTPFDDPVTRGFGWGSGTVDKLATDSSKQRSAYDVDLLDAFSKGEGTYELKDADGKVIRTYTLHPEGLNYLDSLTVWQNSALAKAVIAPIFGDEYKGKFNMSAAAFKFKHAYVESTETATKVATAKRDAARNRISEIFKDIKGRYTDENKGATEKSKAIYSRVVGEAKAKVDDALANNMGNKQAVIDYAKARVKATAEGTDAPERTKIITSGALPKEYEAVPAITLGLYTLNEDGSLDASNIDVKAGKIAYDSAANDSAYLIKLYNDGDLDDDGSFMTGKKSADGKGFVINRTKNVPLPDGTEIELDDSDMECIKRAAASGQQFDADFVVSIMYKKRFAQAEKAYAEIEKRFGEKRQEIESKRAEAYTNLANLRPVEEASKVPTELSVEVEPSDPNAIRVLDRDSTLQITSESDTDLARYIETDILNEYLLSEGVNPAEVGVLGTDANKVAVNTLQGLLQKCRIEDEEAGLRTSRYTESVRFVLNKIKNGTSISGQNAWQKANQKAKEWSTPDRKVSPSEAYYWLYGETGFSEDINSENGSWNKNISPFGSKSYYFDVTEDANFVGDSDRVIDIAFSSVEEGIKKYNADGQLDATDRRMLDSVRVDLMTRIRESADTRFNVFSVRDMLLSMLPDAELYSTAKRLGVMDKLYSLDANGFSPASLLDTITNDYIAKKTSGALNSAIENDYLNAIALLSDMADNSHRATLGTTESALTRNLGEDTDTESVLTALATEQNETPEEAYTRKLEQSNEERQKSQAEMAIEKRLNSERAYDRNGTNESIEALSKVLGGFQNKKSPYYSPYVAETSKAKRNVDKFIENKISGNNGLLAKAKVLYGQNEKFKALVDSWSANRQQLAKAAGVKAISKTPVDNDYLNALGLVRPGYELTPTGNSKNHRTAEEYYAALNNVDNNASPLNGYSQGLYNKMYIGAASKGTHIEQLLGAADILRAFGADVEGFNKTLEDFSSEANGLVSKLPYPELTSNQLDSLKKTIVIDNVTYETRKSLTKSLKDGQTLTLQDIRSWQQGREQVAELQQEIQKITSDAARSRTKSGLERALEIRRDMNIVEQNLNAIRSKFKSYEDISTHGTIDGLIDRTIADLAESKDDMIKLYASSSYKNDRATAKAQADLNTSLDNVLASVYDPSLNKLLALSSEAAGQKASDILQNINRLRSVQSETSSPTKAGEINTYSGKVTPSANTVIVFGSNTEGRHGKGTAKDAYTDYGAQYGVEEGLVGNSYAMPTKDLASKERMPEEEVTKNISSMYEEAKKNPSKQFKVAYDSDNNLNGYKLSELAQMFLNAGEAPKNVYFSEAMANEMRAIIGEEPVAQSTGADYSGAGKEYIMHSGGAVGSDSVFDTFAKQYGIKRNHYYARSENSTPKGNVGISEEAVAEGLRHAVIANNTLKRQIPNSDYAKKLIARNWMQVANADAIYAIGTISKTTKNDSAPKVNGGTGWAVQMALDNGKPVHVFDQKSAKWYTVEDGKWVETGVPTLTKNFAGIGTRSLTDSGRFAIEELFKTNFEGGFGADSAEYQNLVRQYHYFSNYADRQAVNPNTGKREFFTRRQANSYNTTPENFASHSYSGDRVNYYKITDDASLPKGVSSSLNKNKTVKIDNADGTTQDVTLRIRKGGEASYSIESSTDLTDSELEEALEKAYGISSIESTEPNNYLDTGDYRLRASYEEDGKYVYAVDFYTDNELYNAPSDYDEMIQESYRKGIEAGEGWVPGGEMGFGGLTEKKLTAPVGAGEPARIEEQYANSMAKLDQEERAANKAVSDRMSLIEESESYYGTLLRRLIGDTYTQTRQSEANFDEVYEEYLALTNDFSKMKAEIAKNANSKSKQALRAIQRYDNLFRKANADDTIVEKLTKEEYKQAVKQGSIVSKEELDAAADEARALVGDELWEELQAMIVQREEAERFLASEDARAVYVTPEGDVFAKTGYRASGAGSVDAYLNALGYQPGDEDKVPSEGETEAALSSKANKKKRKEMQKKINENLNQNTSGYKKSTESYKPLDFEDLDEASRQKTLKNMLDFKSSANELLGERYGISADDDYNVILDKNYASMLEEIIPKADAFSAADSAKTTGAEGSDETAKEKAKEKLAEARKAAVNKFITIRQAGVQLTKDIQDFQMAGGFANVNAFSIVQLRQAMYRAFSLNPLRATKSISEYLNLAYQTRNSAAAYNFAYDLIPFLQENASMLGDTTPLTDLHGVMTRTPGVNTAGVTNELISGWLNQLDEIKNTKGIKKNLKNIFLSYRKQDLEALFSNATFKNTLPIFRAWMLKQNYDEAVRAIRKKKSSQNYDEATINRLAHYAAYGQTLSFFEPSKTRGKTLAQIVENTATKADRERLASLTHEVRGSSYLDVAGNVFFALRYKMALAGQVLSGTVEALSPAEMIRKGKVVLDKGDWGVDEKGNLSSKSDYLDTFIHKGDLSGIGAMATISIICAFWAHAMGVPSAWDDIQWTDSQGNLQIPNILQKIQTIGQFWLPNEYDKEKGFYIDPSKKQTGLDFFSSTFTLPNSLTKTVDKSINSNAYNKNQRGIGLIGQELGINPQGINDILNNDIAAAVGDELIAANLLSPFKAMYEILTDNTYFGNNIWEKKYLPDGSLNKNYDPFRNMTASFFHLLNLDWFLTNGTNAYVKGKYSDYENRVLSKDYVAQDNIGTVAGSGVFQHEFVTAAINLINGETLDGIVEAGELPIKTRNLSTQARTEFNTKVKNTIMQFAEEYKKSVNGEINPNNKDQAYKAFVKKAADEVAAWSAKWDYVLGENQELVAYATRALMAVCAGNYDDNLNYVQNAYWKATQIAQIEQPTSLFLDDKDLEEWIKAGKSEEDFAKEKQKRSDAWHQALINEYEAMQALKDAGVDMSYITREAGDYFSAYKGSVNKEIYEGIHNVLESKYAQFDNFKQMKEYYEQRIEAVQGTKAKSALAEEYNTYVKDALAPYVNKYGAAIFRNAYYNGEGLAKSIADYIIIPANKNYNGKNPKVSYLQDFFHVGYNDRTAMPSDTELIERFVNAQKVANQGYAASAAKLLDGIIEDVKKGKLHVTNQDYNKIINMRALLSARSK